MRGLLSSLRDRPINDRERPRLLLIIAAGLAAVAVVLPSSRPSIRHVARPRPATRQEASGVLRGTPAAEADRVSETFLAGYLGFVYGHGTARFVQDAAEKLRHSLQSHPPRVSPAMLAAHPRVLSLTAARAGGGEVTVRALINDGGLADYTIALQLSPSHGRLLVASVEEG